jgi:hypothetical protein
VEGTTDRFEGLAARPAFVPARRPQIASLLAHPAAPPVALVALAAVLYAPHVITGGFVGDDWGYEADARIPRSLGAVISWLAPRTNHGELHAVYQLVVHRVFAGNLKLHMIWLAVLAAATGLMFYYLLRELSVRRTGAMWMAAAVMLMPLAAATHLWVTGGAGGLAVILAMFGAWCALRGLKQRSVSRGVLLHLAALMCYATSLLLYELAAPAIAVSILLYARVAPWRRAILPWVADLCLTVVILVHIASLNTTPKLPMSEQLHHAVGIARASAKAALAVGFILPSGHRRFALNALLAASASVVLVLLGLSFGQLCLTYKSRRSEAVKHSFKIIGIGIATIALAYILFVPSYLQPPGTWVDLRLNGFAVLGFAILFYGFGRLAKAWLPRRMPFGITPQSLVAVAGIAVIVSYAVKTEVSLQRFGSARGEQAQIHSIVTQLNRCYAHGGKLQDGGCGGLLQTWGG